jgi:large subunit ribosomal protein L9
MQVILLERVEKLGIIGEVVSVRPGFARNYLLPQKKAIRASAENSVRFESQRTQIEAVNLERRKEAEQVAQRMDGLVVTMIRQAGESGQLYGSVTARDIADAVSEAGFTVTRGQVRLDRAIKVLGLHTIRTVLHPEVDLTVTANIAKSQDEAKLQLERGGAVTDAQLAAEEDAAEEALAAAEAALAKSKDGRSEASDEQFDAEPS